MADARISHIELDEATILWRNADIEQERRIAMFDLIEDNTFKPLRAYEAGHHGPYRLRLSVRDGRLSLDVADADDAHGHARIDELQEQVPEAPAEPPPAAPTKDPMSIQKLLKRFGIK